MSDYCKQNLTSMHFKAENSWIVLSPIEKRIKEKIEKAGKPLKNWDINIYRGILTGYNKAFIIDKETKDRLIAKSSKNAEIIRPILRGRDIKRYRADFADLWIINSHNGYGNIPAVNIEDYPDIKVHLDCYIADLQKRKDKGITPYNLRSCIYMEDFSKQKIVWGEISDKSKFALDEMGMYPEATTFLMTGNNLKFLLAILNSKLGEWSFNQIGTRTGMGTNRWKKYTLESLVVKTPTSEEKTQIEILVTKIIHEPSKENITALDNAIYQLYQLTDEEISFIEAQ